jgi:ring-1,2-phenylacetyl-CoA epoxidase subunit PaaD
VVNAVAAPSAQSAHIERAEQSARAQRAWAVLDAVLDPEVPALSLCDLGVVREVHDLGAVLEVVLTPTYSGCPATEVIESSVRGALEADGLGPVELRRRLAPAWTTDWISEAGRRKLREYGIAPPGATSSAAAGATATAAAQPIRIRPLGLACPRCDSHQTERLSAFGSTACKALHRCLECGEPFEYFKPI